MDELWWWVIPLAETGIVCTGLALLIAFLTKESDSPVPVVICLALCLPFAAAGISTLVWILCKIFFVIWTV